MTENAVRQTFLDACNDWVCDGYFVDIRYMARRDQEEHFILDATLTLYPLKPTRDNSLELGAAGFLVGQVQRGPESKAALLELLERAASGVLDVGGQTITLPTDVRLHHQSEMNYRDRWFSGLHLQVNGGVRDAPPTTELVELDNNLRGAIPPFDGLSDLSAWLGLEAPSVAPKSASVVIRVSPPVDLVFDECSLKDDQLKLILHAHPDYDVMRTGLAIRGVPGDGLLSRQQITNEIQWGAVRDERRVGVAQVSMPKIDSALAMLKIGTSTVRRQWFLDPQRARNQRLLAMRHFDNDLRMVKQAIFESTDSRKFEHGVAALLFLLGFSPSGQLETNAPDLIVVTPGGRIVIVECTIRVADVAAKLGKLVDRRGSLITALKASGHEAQVTSALVCRLPRDQIAAHAESIRTHKTVLVAQEELVKGLDSVRAPNDPDKLLEEVRLRLFGNGNGPLA